MSPYHDHKQHYNKHFCVAKVNENVPIKPYIMDVLRSYLRNVLTSYPVFVR